MRRHNLKSLRKFEKLEDRRMMVGDNDFDEDEGILTITGGNFANAFDSAQVRFEGDEVIVDLYAGEGNDEYDHRDRAENISQVNKIVFNGLSGPDILNVIISNEGVDETL